MTKKQYVKVTKKDNTSFVGLASNEAFYKSQGFTISEPTDEEVASYFPTAAKPSTIAQPLVSPEDLDQLKSQLLTETNAHAETKNLLTSVQGELKKIGEAFSKELEEHSSTKKELDEARKQHDSEIQKLKADHKAELEKASAKK